jgi:hypothetical protein
MTARTLLSSALLCLAALSPTVALAQTADAGMGDTTGVLYIWLAILVGGGVVSGIAMVAVNSRR